MFKELTLSLAILCTGRWAQRVDSTGITVKSHYNADSVIPFPAPKLDSAAEEQANSKDSSIEPYKQQVSKSQALVGLFDAGL